LKANLNADTLFLRVQASSKTTMIIPPSPHFERPHIDPIERTETYTSILTAKGHYAKTIMSYYEVVDKIPRLCIDVWLNVFGTANK
jgi:hypothetical protein